jgi:hypothetical protein
MENQQTITLNYAVESYLNHLGDLNKKEATIGVYRRSLDIALLYFGTEKDITGIMLPHAGKFFNSEQVNKHPNGRPKAKPTIMQTKRVFRQCLEFAKEQGWLQNLPIPKSEMQHARKKSEPPEKEIAPRLRGQDFLPVTKHHE